MDEDVTQADEQVVENQDEEVELTQEQQEEQDALLAVNGDVKGELKPNRSLDADPEIEEEEDVESETTDTSGDSEEETETAGEEEPDSGSEQDTESAPNTEPAVELTPESDETGVYSPVTAKDPGDFRPGDYSFTVQTTDGKTVRIAAPEDADALAAELDNNPELISASQFLAMARKTTAMEQNIANDRRLYDQQKEHFDSQAAQTATREQHLTQWQGEINYLRTKGELPEITSQLNSADWTDPNIAKEPAVKETLALFKWMETENEKRMAAGLPPDLSVVSAYNSRQLEMIKNEERDTTSRQKAATRARGSMVGKKAPYTPSNTPKGTIVGGAKSLDDLASEAYYANQE